MFDLDGTLLDTSPGIYNGLNHLTEEMNLIPLSPEIMPDLIGPPLMKSYSKYFGLKGEDVDKASNIYINYYKNKGHKKFEHYPGMPELLQALKDQNFKTAIVTMKEQKTTDLVVGHSGLSKYFDHVQGNGKLQTMTKKDLIQETLNHFNISPENALFIGDTSVDAKGAFEAGVLFVPALYGFGFSHNDTTENFPYFRTVSSPSEILDLVTGQE